MLKRLKQTFTRRPADAQGPAEPDDPRSAMRSAFERQVDALRDVRRALVEATAARRRLALRAEQLEAEATAAGRAAEAAVEAGNDDAARAALRRQQAAEKQMQPYATEATRIAADIERLESSERRLREQVEALRITIDTLDARMTAAEAAARVSASIAAAHEEAGDARIAIELTRRHTTMIEARAEVTALADPDGDWEAAFERADGGSRP